MSSSISSDESLYYRRLLDLSEPIAKVRNRKELLEIIYKGVKEIFPFDDAGLFTLDDTGENHIDWVVEDELTEEGSEIKKQGIAGFMPHKGSVIEGMMQDKPTLLGYEEINQRYPGHPQYQTMKTQGIKQFICRALFQENGKIGMLCFNSKQDDFFTDKDFRLFDSIANQINVAVLNILANEEIQRREQEKTNLLRISEAIASVKSREDLLNAMLGRIKPLVDYEDAVITIYESNYTRYRHFISSSPGSRKKDAQYHAIMGKSHPLQNTPDEYVLKQLRKTGILFWKTKAMKQKYPKHFIPGFLEKHRLVQNMYLRLVWNNELIGFLHFHFNDKKKVEPSKSSFYQSIADQLSATVANIIANEQVLEERQFKETLLGISEAIITIQDFPELIQFIGEEIQPLFDFEDFGLITVAEDNKTHREFTVQNPSVSPHQVNQKILEEASHSFPHEGSVIEHLMQKEGPFCYQYDTLLTEGWQHPALHPMIDSGMLYAMSSTLRYQDKSIGFFTVNTSKKDFFKSHLFKKFKAISDLLAISVNNLLFSERLLEEKQFKETLLSISEAVATINDREQLLKVIYDRIQPVFPFDNAGLFIIDEEKDLMYEIIDGYTSPNDLQNTLTEQGLLGPWKLNGSNPKSWWMQDGLVIDSIAHQMKYAKGHVGHDQFKEGTRHGLKQMIGGPLMASGKKTGAICFNVKEENYFGAQHERMFKNISEQIGIAVANILAKEQVLEEKRFKEILLGISEAMAKIQTGPELMKVIVGALQPTFNFHDIGLFVFNQERDFLNDWVVKYPDLSDSDGSQEMALNPTTYGSVDISKGTAANFLLSKLQKEGSPLITNLKELAKRFPDFIQHDIIKRVGYEDTLVAELRQGGEVLGFFCLNALEKGLYKQEQFPLFQAIADQLAVAVSNILANEQVLEEKSFKETLLDISESVVSIQNREDLLGVIIEKVKPIFKFYDVGLMVVNEAEDWFEDLTVSKPEISQSEGSVSMHQAPEINRRIAYTNSVIEFDINWLKENGGPVIYDYKEDIIKQFPDFEQTALLKKIGYKEGLMALLKDGGKVMGLFTINSLEKGHFSSSQFSLFQAISDNIAMVVANILANEQIREEKTFKETLLTISEGIASIRSKPELLKYIVQKLNPIFNFYDTGILILDKEKERYTDWSAYYLVDESPTSKIVFDNYEDGTLWNPLKGSGVEWSIKKTTKTKQPIVFDWTQNWSQLSDQKITKALQKVGFVASLVYPFKLGNEVLGTFWINYRKGEDVNKVSKPLFQSVCDQLAVAISNILANEEIARRERLKTLQVETVTIFNQDKNWDERFEEFIQTLQPHIPFHFASIDLWDDETDYNRCKNIERIGSNEYRLWRPDDFERASGIPKKESSSAYSIARNWHFEERKTPVSQSKAHKTILKILNKIMDIGPHIDLSIPLQDDRRFLLSLYKKNTAPYTPEQIALLQGLKDTLGQTIEKALITERVNELNQQLAEEKAYLQEEVKETYGFEEIIGKSEKMQEVFSKVAEIANINSTVLILGETGTGKELIARAIHNNSPRRDRVLVKVNCAAIPSQIVESELFGHEKGAFTGAIKQRIGKFELANQGTIFLDEIGDMPLELQAKLLRVLQEREVERVGSNTMIKLDFRVIAATNKNLEELVAEGKFRADLFYRLNTFPIYLPALRERKGDAALLAQYFAKQYAQNLGLPFKGLSKKSVHNIESYEWPGNVRELQNSIEQAIVLQRGKTLDIAPHRVENNAVNKTTSIGLGELPETYSMDYINAQKERLEKEYLIHMLEKTKWRVRGKGGAAELLDVHPNSLDYYLKKLGINKK